eukprot:1156104-Pelagomonas_calceolata.AAC.7
MCWGLSIRWSPYNLTAKTRHSLRQGTRFTQKVQAKKARLKTGETATKKLSQEFLLAPPSAAPGPVTNHQVDLSASVPSAQNKMHSPGPYGGLPNTPVFPLLEIQSNLWRSFESLTCICSHTCCPDVWHSLVSTTATQALMLAHINYA